MDPLTLFVASIVGAALLDGSRSANVRTFYDKEKPGYQGWIGLKGRRVTWWVEPGAAVWIEARYLRPLSGNIFYGDKLRAVADTLRSGRELEFGAPYGQISRIDRDAIQEYLAYQDDIEGPPWTTGDEELDAYLTDPETFLEDHADDEEERAELEARLEAELLEAEQAGDGDFGAWTAVVRDGNHRAFGSVLGGERSVAIRIYDNDICDLQEAVRSGFKGYRADENRALLAKAIADTGQEPWWLERCAAVARRIP